MRRPDIEPIHKRRLREAAAKQKRIAAYAHLMGAQQASNPYNNWQVFNAALGQAQNNQFNAGAFADVACAPKAICQTCGQRIANL